MGELARLAWEALLGPDRSHLVARPAGCPASPQPCCCQGVYGMADGFVRVDQDVDAKINAGMCTMRRSGRQA